MAVSPFRALARAHVESTLNRLRRQLGSRGLIALVIFVTIIALVSVLPITLGLGALGFFVGYSIEDAEASRWIPFISLLLTAFPVFGGFLGGIAGGTRQLPWEMLRAFPVRDRTLFAGEFFAGIVEPITLVELTGLTLFCGGACVGAPAAAPYFLVLLVTHGLALLSIQQAVGSFAQRIAKRFRVVLLFLPLAGMSMSWLAPQLAAKAQSGSFDSWLGWLELSTRWLPARGLFDAAHGNVGPLRIAVALITPVVLLGGVTLLAFVLVSRERDADFSNDSGKPATLWSFRSQTMGIARLQLQTLATSIPGRFGLLMPLLTLVLIRGPLAMVFTGKAWTAQVAFAYASLAGANLLFNQFGLDRHGVKVLLLLPIEERAILRGKLLGFAVWQSLQAALLFGLLILSGQRDLLDLFAGLALYLCVFLIFSIAGQFTSIWQPRPLQRGGLRSAQPPLLVVLFMMGVLLSTGLLLYALRFAFATFVPGWELAGFLVFALILLAALVPALELNTRFLSRSRERLVETLGASG